MTVFFQGAELVKFAVQLETNGYDFYRQASAKLAVPDIKGLFDDLARQELEHKAVFEGLIKQTGRPTTAESYTGEYDSYLKAYVDSYVFTLERMRGLLARPVLEVKEAIQFGVDSEKDTILYYIHIKKAVRKTDGPVIERIIAEERRHFTRLVQLLRALG
jgi:rubrerythrin